MTKILFLGCHLDDIEYGCGGLISKLVQKNKQLPKNFDMKFLTLSIKNEDALGRITLTRDFNETIESFKALGIDNFSDINTKDIPGQKFQYYTQDIREELLKYKNNYNPDVIFFPSIHDIHQDHKVLAEEGFRIFRNQTCIGYEIIRSCYYLKPNLFVELTETELKNKTKSVLKYKTQLYQSSGYYFSNKVIKSLAITNGTRCGKEYAEAYEIYTMQA